MTSIFFCHFPDGAGFGIIARRPARLRDAETNARAGAVAMRARSDPCRGDEVRVFNGFLLRIDPLAMPARNRGSSCYE
jgi:hypothetical protein